MTEFQQYVTKTSKMLLIGEIVRARASSGEGTTPEGYQQLADTGIEELMNDSNILRAAVALARGDRSVGERSPLSRRKQGLQRLQERPLA